MRGIVSSVTGSPWKVDFMCIGAMKAGTTWIHGILAEHPEVGMGSGKEVHFFDDEQAYAKGLDHYRSFFAHCAPGRLLGEVTPRYIHMPVVAGRIHAHNPDAKLIASLRNPIDRAWSQYRFDIHQGGRMSFYKSFEDAIGRPSTSRRTVSSGMKASSRSIRTLWMSSGSGVFGIT